MMLDIFLFIRCDFTSRFVINLAFDVGAMYLKCTKGFLASYS